MSSSLTLLLNYLSVIQGERVKEKAFAQIETFIPVWIEGLFNHACSLCLFAIYSGDGERVWETCPQYE